MKDTKAYLKPATEELKEAVVQTATTAGIKPLAMVDLETAATPADIIDTLFMKILDGQLYTPDYKFELSSSLPYEMVRLGNKEYKYNEYKGTSDTLDIKSPNTMDDFNGDELEIYAEVYKLDTPFHKKVKLPELVLSNA
ncbi:MAG: hypothetical protein ACK5MR_17595 [Cumulibacter sp.]